MPFCKTSAQRAIQFIERNCRHTKGIYAGSPFQLEPWQRDGIIAPLFGTVREDGARQYRRAFVFLPRKNGKSELGAAIALKLLCADGEQSGEIVSAAKTKEQALAVFNVAKRMVQLSPTLNRRVQIYEATKTLIYPRTNTVYKVIAADGGAAHGGNLSGVIFDELHTQRSTALFEALETSMGSMARRQPLFLVITTWGHDHAGLCKEELDYAKKIRNRVVEDPEFFAFIAQADKNDDWKDEKIWHKANPGLGVFRSLEEMRSYFRKAVESKRKEVTFRLFYLNQEVETGASEWLTMEKWDATAGYVIEDDLVGLECWGGLDLSTNTDLTAFVLVFKMPDGRYHVLPRFWIPKDNIIARSERDAQRYDQWLEEGLIFATDGDVIDLNAVKGQILKDAEKYQIKEIAFDPYGATKLVTELQDEEITMVSHRQGFVSMNAPMKETERLILGRDLVHGGNKVMRHQFSSMVIQEDSLGNIRPCKKKVKKGARIDGVVAMVMGVGRAALQEEKGNTPKNPYNERELLAV